MSEPNEGWITEKQILNQRVSGECPQCKNAELLWLERILIEGSLKNYHLLHTEANDVYPCEKCKHTWKEFLYL